MTTDRPRGTRRGRDQVDRRRPRAAQVLVWEVEDPLIRVRVDRRHEALLDRERVAATFAIGATQFVVQDAFEMILCVSPS